MPRKHHDSHFVVSRAVLSGRRPGWVRGLRIAVAAAVACAPLLWVLPAKAQATADEQPWLQSTQQWLDQAVQQSQNTEMPLRMEVSVGTLDSRLRLAPCSRVEPYLPAGSRLWGNTRLGLRCVQGTSRWNVFLPITVKAFGPAWVLSAPLSSGAVLTENDAHEAEVDWAQENAAIMATPEQWLGKVASRPLLAGAALRQGMVRAPTLFQAGTRVKLQAEGPGYMVTSSGQAMAAGAAGQTVRIRMDNGKILSGTVNEDASVTAPF